MKKVAIAALGAGFAVTCVAQGIITAPMTEEALKRTGGRIVKPDTQKGEIVVVNAQKTAEAKWVESSAAQLAATTLFKVSTKTGTFDLRNPQLAGNATLFVVDDAALPMSLVAPEAHWAAVNVAPLKSEKPAFFEMRVRKEIARTFALLCGGANSRFPAAIVGAVSNVGDLDQFGTDKLPADVIAHFPAYMSAFGATPARLATYINACRQGWAPAPTNDYQKAIWDREYAIPAKPIKIRHVKTDTKK